MFKHVSPPAETCFCQPWASSRTQIRSKKLNWLTHVENGKEGQRDLGFNLEERLQGLPIDHTLIPGISATDRTSLIGNALMPQCVTFLLKEAMRRANILDPKDERVLELEENNIGLNVLSTSTTDAATLLQEIREACHSDEGFKTQYAGIEDGGRRRGSENCQQGL